MVFRSDLLDGVIAEEMLKALQPAELELALAALHELESRDQSILRQWQMRLERSEYEVALAERRYQEVDPLCALRSYVTCGCEMLCWRSSSTVPGTHNYSDFRKAMRPAS
jgi:hypothetical protein